MRTLHAGDGLDRNGFIVSDVSLDKINYVYLPCIEESVEKLKRLFPHELHSVYLYGSVARGEAIPNKSDLDLLALFNPLLTPDAAAELKSLAKDMSHTYCSLVRDVGIAVGDYNYALNPANYYEQAFLRELCVCLYGEDLRDRFGPYKLTSEIAISFNGDIGEVLNQTIPRLEAASDLDFKTITQAFARKLIRTYYSMVMARSQIWSTRLHDQCQVFARYFPEKQPMIRTLQKWIDGPPSDRGLVVQFFTQEGIWASENFTREAKIPH